ncbi:MAG: hypothetical protein ACPW60_12765 [Methylohalobius sp. ZOD2]|nr:hypothetical protein [Methylothermaceae bacterium]
MRIVLHIGTHKTGSTALQRFLYLNRERLLDQGWLYPRTGLKGTGHHPIAWRIRSGGADVCREMLSALEKEAREVGVQGILLSSEAFEFIRDVKALEPFCHRDTIPLVFLRRQDGYLESEYNQHVKMPSTRYAFDIYRFYFRLDFSFRFNYRQLCDRWQKVAGDNCLHVINYDHCLNTRRCEIFRRFLSRVGVQWRKAFVLPDDRTSNLSIPSRATIYLARINRLNLPLEKHLQAIKAVAQRFASDAEDSLLSLEERQLLCQRYQAGNHFVAKYYGSDPFSLPEDDGKIAGRSRVDFYEDFDRATYEDLLRSIRV